MEIIQWIIDPYGDIEKTVVKLQNELIGITTKNLTYNLGRDIHKASERHTYYLSEASLDCPIMTVWDISEK